MSFTNDNKSSPEVDQNVYSGAATAEDSAPRLLFNSTTGAPTHLSMSEQVVYWACSAMYIYAKGNKARMYQSNLLQAGAGDLVVKLISKFSESEDIIFVCCRILVVLLVHNDSYKTKFGNTFNLCAIVVEALHTFPSSSQVCLCGVTI